MTRARLQEELERIWARERITMILVTHDVEEAVYLSDRIVIMEPRPGRIKRIVDVPLERTRDRSSFGFVKVKEDLLSDFDVLRPHQSRTSSLPLPPFHNFAW
jgi:ABC-type nitrate/sulfonate/bicarbonate transport system ATPase subunit